MLRRRVYRPTARRDLIGCRGRLAEAQLPVLAQLVARSFAETRCRYPEVGREG